MSDEHAHEPSEVTYAEYFHPARPRSLRYRTRVKQSFERHTVKTDGPPNGDNPAYVSWLLSAVDAGRRQRDQPAVLRPGLDVAEPVRQPEPPRRGRDGVGLVHRLPVVADHPSRRVVPQGAGRRGDVEGVRRDRHRGHPHRAGQAGRRASPAGSRPPASTATSTGSAPQIDPAFGTEDEFRAMCGTANWYGGTIIDDIVPGHTGKGADFRLAEMKYADYPGIYHMVEIDPQDWNLLPDVPAGARLGQHRRRDRGVAGQGRLHHRAAAAGDLLRRGRQGDELECHRAGRRHRRRRAPLGVPALLQGGPALDQLAGPVVRRDAAGHRRRAALADRPRLRRRCGWTPTVSSGAEKQPPRAARVVGGPPAVRGRQPPHREHGAQGRRLHLPGTQPDHRRHPRDRRGRCGPVLRLHQPARLPPRAGHRRHRVPPADVCAPPSSSASTPPRWCTPCRTTTS